MRKTLILSKLGIMCKTLAAIILLSCIAVLHAGAGYAAIADCSGTSCMVSVYNSASPRDFSTKSLTLTIPKNGSGEPIAFTGTQVQLTLGSRSQTVNCDGSTQNLGTAPYPDLQGTISCTLTVLKTGINATVSLWDRNTYSNYYSTAPSINIDGLLEGTSQGNPASTSDDTGTAYRWQVQNVNDPTLTQRRVPVGNWVVFARTEATLAMSYTVAAPPPYPFTQEMCMGDVNNNSLIDQDESQSCITTPQGQLCPVAAAVCTSSTQPPVCANGTYSTTTHRCETTPTCPNGGNFVNGRCEISSPINTEYCWTWEYRYRWDHAVWCDSQWIYNIVSDANGCAMPGFFEDPNCNYTQVNKWGTTTGSMCASNTAPSGAAQAGWWVGAFHNWPGKHTDAWHCYERAYWSYQTSSACPGGFTRDGNICWQSATCPTDYNVSGSTCIKAPTCNIGFTISGDQCVSNTPDVCPGGGSACMLYNGQWMCNAYPCQQFGSAPIVGTETTPEGVNDLEESTVDANGNCDGALYVFNGQDRRCRQRSMYTGFTSCCYTASSEDDCNKQVWMGFSTCKAEENDLSCKKLKGLCVELDDYCSKTISILGHDVCVQRKTVSCCFGSKLGRIIQEQGRRQLKAFNHTGVLMPQPADAGERHAQNMHLFTLGGSGNPEQSYCRGLTFEEFSSLNWDLIDLKEFTDGLATEVKDKADQQIQQKMSELQTNPPQIVAPPIP